MKNFENESQKKNWNQAIRIFLEGNIAWETKCGFKKFC
jgi:hypothetical protein